MSFIKLTKERYSVRKFSGKAVEDEKLNLILEAGRLSPTAVNYQPQRILVIRGEEGMDKLKSCRRDTFGAPLALLVCYDKNVSWKNRSGKEYGEVDAAIVITQMMYAAQELGLGSLWAAGYKEDDLKKAFSIPDFLVPVSVLLLGYPAEDAEPHPTLHYSRHELEKTVFYDSFEGIEAGENTQGKH
ncbi:MAG: nitroreductase family protein [Oscillospiraceae bacterium]|nr:nitroreductase family protein [Oscillospiraceae bacterium]